jgi:hypothetical protein
MLSQPDGPFINVPKLNLAKYAQRQNLAKVKYVHQAKAPTRCFPKLLHVGYNDQLLRQLCNGSSFSFLVTF